MRESIGKEIEISLFKKVDKEKQFSGTLIKFDDEKIYIKVDSDEKGIERAQISQIKLKYNW